MSVSKGGDFQPLIKEFYLYRVLARVFPSSMNSYEDGDAISLGGSRLSKAAISRNGSRLQSRGHDTVSALGKRLTVIKSDTG